MPMIKLTRMIEKRALKAPSASRVDLGLRYAQTVAKTRILKVVSGNPHRCRSHYSWRHSPSVSSASRDNLDAGSAHQAGLRPTFAAMFSRVLSWDERTGLSS